MFGGLYASLVVTRDDFQHHVEFEHRLSGGEFNVIGLIRSELDMTR